MPKSFANFWKKKQYRKTAGNSENQCSCNHLHAYSFSTSKGYNVETIAFTSPEQTIYKYRTQNNFASGKITTVWIQNVFLHKIIIY